MTFEPPRTESAPSFFCGKISSSPRVGHHRSSDPRSTRCSASSGNNHVFPQAGAPFSRPVTTLPMLLKRGSEASRSSTTTLSLVNMPGLAFFLFFLSVAAAGSPSFPVSLPSSSMLSSSSPPAFSSDGTCAHRSGKYQPRR